MELFVGILNTFIMPVMLLICGCVLAYSIRLWRIMSPVSFIRTVKDSSGKDGVSPFKAMCTALAGTLGVGNIAGVATAITAGGAGAVMWMWIGAAVSMSVKYAEVALAVKYRIKNGSGYIGGAMYTIKEGLKKHVGKTSSLFFGGLFALLCLANSFVTGNIVQSNSAAAVFPNVSPKAMGIAFAIGIICIAAAGTDRISSITFALIPPLSAVYIVMSLSVICRNLSFLPSIIADIMRGAFSVSAAVGGAAGIGIREAVRYGITRGIFSNEAGCGTAPSAHASANTNSPHHQGCFGIFEVIADTMILCSMTAFVILIGQKKYPALSEGSDGVPLTLEAFGSLLGPAAYYVIGISVILFAFATVIAQLYYGKVAMSYFTDSKSLQIIYTVASAICAYIGAGMDSTVMWTTADAVVGVMTVINVTVLFVLRKEAGSLSSEQIRIIGTKKKHSVLICRKERQHSS